MSKSIYSLLTAENNYSYKVAWMHSLKYANVNSVIYSENYKREALVMDNGRLLKGHLEGKTRIMAL